MAETYRSNFLNILLKGEYYLLGQSFELFGHCRSNRYQASRINAEVNQLDGRSEVCVVVRNVGTIKGVCGVLHY